MSDELIRKSDVLNLLNNTEVGECPYNCVGAALIAIHDAVENTPPVNAVELPCKIGDMVYEFCKPLNKVYSYEITGFTIKENALFINCYTHNYYFSELGVKVFLSREEAEKASEETENENK